MTGIMQMFVAAKSAAVTVKDTFFNFVTLLLNTNSTINSTNNAILYLSSNDYQGSVTRNGNVTQGTFTPFSSAGWSCAFPSGGTNFITVADNTTLRFGTANFTIEAFVYRTTAGVSQTIACKGGASTGWNLAVNSSNQLVFTHTSTNIISAATLAANTWHYVAVVRTGTGANQTRLWINGVGDTTGSISTNFTQSTALVIGVDRSVLHPWDGYLSNIRLSNVARDVSVVPTVSLTYDANTIFLGLHTNRFQYVNSSNAFVTMTPTLSPLIEPFSPFAPITAYSVTDSGGSGYFDGTGDYLSFPDAAQLQFVDGQFTINCWVYRTVGGVVHTIASKGATSPSVGWNLAINASNQVVFSHGTGTATSTATVPLGTWAYISVVRNSTSGSGCAIYVNAGLPTTFASSVNFNQTNNLLIGASRDAGNPQNFAGYICGFEYIKGSAIAPPSVPTAPPTLSRNPALLLNFTNAGIYDMSTKNDLETVGDAKVSATRAKFGTTSMFFKDEGGDALAFWAYPLTNFVSNDFTVEFWMYITANPTTNTFVISAGPNGAGGTRRGWGVRLHDGTTASLTFVAQVGTTSQSNSFGSLPSTNAWHHIAFSRNGSSMRCFVNGTQLGSTWTIPTSTFNQVGQYDYASISGYDNNGTGYPARYWFKGYLDEVRITNGVGRYEVNFPAPTQPFPIQ